MIWMMSLTGCAHAVPEDMKLVAGLGNGACSRLVHFDLSSDAEDPKCTECVTAIADLCGTYRGYQRHRRKKTTPCEACREANNAYQRVWRETHPRSREGDAEHGAARYRARMRLVAENREAGGDAA